MSMPRVCIELTENQSQTFSTAQVSESVGLALWRHYAKQVDVEFPSPKTHGQWKLSAKGWVGYVPLSPQLGLSLRPKVALGNLFRMLEYAYRLKSIQFLHGLYDSQSIEEFYERLANVLAQRVLDRGRKGFYRAYLPQRKRLPYVRGRLETRSLFHTPWKVNLDCRYQEQTADVTDNQILAWTLFLIARSGICSERVLPTIRRAYRQLRGFVSAHAFDAHDCVGRTYSRLNDDYRPLHALCHFFLEHSGPRHETGDHAMLPFLVNMARLYEQFVAAWLERHPLAGLTLKPQQSVNIGNENDLRFIIDLALYDAKTDTARYVLDTKYKTPSAPATDDIAQIVAYAEASGCREAVLIYPVRLNRQLDTHVGDIHVRSLTFSLEGDLEMAGQTFVQDLLRDT